MSIANARRWLHQLSEVTPSVDPRYVKLPFGLAVWYAFAAVFPEDLMPFPHEVFAIAFQLVVEGHAYRHLASTLWLTFWGFVGSMIVGIAIGVLMGLNAYSRNFFTLHVVIGLSIPAIAWAAITSLVFGYSFFVPVVSTVMITFPIVAINVWKGVESIDVDLLTMSDAFGLSNWRQLAHVVVPDTASSLFAASRFGLAISWKIVTIAEMFVGNKGVGYMIVFTYEQFQYEQSWAWALLFTLIILAIEYGVFKRLERRMYRYKQRDVQTVMR